jgi:hypothetical protein
MEFYSAPVILTSGAAYVAQTVINLNADLVKGYLERRRERQGLSLSMTSTARFSSE